MDKSEHPHFFCHWEKIEKKFKFSPDWIGDFIYDYVILKNNASEYRQHTYSKEFKGELIELLNSPTEENLESMLRHADFYIDYVRANDLGYSSKFGEHRSLRLFGYTPGILVMKLRDLLVSTILSEETYKKMISLLESYRVRLAVTGEPNHWEIFYKMTPLICENDPFMSFKNAIKEMKNKDSRYEFPNDKEFLKHFDKIDFYDDWCRPVLYRLENCDRNIQFTPPEKYYQIEHIMPQTINRKWESVLGENHKNIHSKWCNRIGNLTLVPSINLNSMLSNKSYEDKKEIAKNYIEIVNQFRLNECVWEKEKWTKNEIKERGKTLAQKAIKIWPDF